MGGICFASCDEGSSLAHCRRLIPLPCYHPQIHVYLRQPIYKSSISGCTPFGAGTTLYLSCKGETLRPVRAHIAIQHPPRMTYHFVTIVRQGLDVEEFNIP